jgi:hypothetical protein
VRILSDLLHSAPKLVHAWINTARAMRRAGSQWSMCRLANREFGDRLSSTKAERCRTRSIGHMSAFLALESRLGSYVGLRGLPGGVELDALYVDLIVRRYEAATGDPPILLGTGELRRATEAASVYDRVRRAFGGRP